MPVSSSLRRISRGFIDSISEDGNLDAKVLAERRNELEYLFRQSQTAQDPITGLIVYSALKGKGVEELLVEKPETIEPSVKPEPYVPDEKPVDSVPVKPAVPEPEDYVPEIVRVTPQPKTVTPKKPIIDDDLEVPKDDEEKELKEKYGKREVPLHERFVLPVASLDVVDGPAEEGLMTPTTSKFQLLGAARNFVERQKYDSTKFQKRRQKSLTKVNLDLVVIETAKRYTPAQVVRLTNPVFDSAKDIANICVEGRYLKLAGGMIPGKEIRIFFDDYMKDHEFARNTVRGLALELNRDYEELWKQIGNVRGRFFENLGRKGKSSAYFLAKNLKRDFVKYVREKFPQVPEQKVVKKGGAIFPSIYEIVNLRVTHRVHKFQAYWTRTCAAYFLEDGKLMVAFDDVADPESNLVMLDRTSLSMDDPLFRGVYDRAKKDGRVVEVGECSIFKSADEFRDDPRVRALIGNQVDAYINVIYEKSKVDPPLLVLKEEMINPSLHIEGHDVLQKRCAGEGVSVTPVVIGGACLEMIFAQLDKKGGFHSRGIYDPMEFIPYGES
jgi:hypothetical protein